MPNLNFLNYYLRSRVKRAMSNSFNDDLKKTSICLKRNAANIDLMVFL